MTRRGRRGTDGAQDGGSWLPDDYGDDDRGYPGHGAPGRHGQRPGPGSPPWETGDWAADEGSPHAPPGPLDPGWHDHPSGPLPASQHPSGPLPPLPGPQWQDDAYPASGYPAGDYPAGSYGPDPGSDAFAPPGDYQPGAIPGDSYPSASYPSGDFPSGDFPSGDFSPGGYRGEEYPAGDRPEGDYATGGYPAAGDYSAAGGYPASVPGGEPPYGSGYAGRGPEPGGPGGEHGFPGQDRRWRDDDHEPGYSGPDPGNGPAYRDRAGWYGDVDEQQAWMDEGEPDSGFLPGLSDDDGPRRGGRGPGRPAGRPPKRKRGGLRRIMPRLFLGLLLLIVLAAGGFGYHVWRTYFHPADYSGPGTGSVVVHITSGETATAVGEQLQRLGVVASARAFGNAAKASPQGNALEAGYYRLHKHMQASLAFAMLLKPSSRVQFKVVIPEGWRLSQIIATLGRVTGNRAGYQRAIKDPAALGLPSYAHGNPEGFLFPATYTVLPGTPPVQVLREMVQRFDQEAASVNLPAVAQHDQLSQHDVIVVASLIQAEGGRLQDFPKIARVIYNRLNSGMQLQLDSTVMYALHRYGIIASNQQLQVNSPYNTYRHAGLPPGPIDSPGDAAIRAALHPAHGNWLYFVTVDPKKGITEFTSDPNVFAQLRAELQANLAKGK